MRVELSDNLLAPISMQFAGNHTPKAAPPSVGRRQKNVVAELSMYRDAPDGDISLEELEKFALDRLHSEWVGLDTGQPTLVQPSSHTSLTANALIHS